MRSSPRMLVAFTFATLLVVGIVLALATDQWIILPVALVLHFLGTVIVMAVTGKALSQRSKPDPVTEARRDEEGAREGAPQGDDEPKPVI